MTRRAFAILPSLFVHTEAGFKPVWNWNDELKKRIRWEDYQKDIEKMSRKLAQKLGFDWRDLAYGEGFFLFERIKEKWNPDRLSFNRYFYSILKHRMLDRLQKKDWRQPGVCKGRGKYFEANICGGVGIDMEKYFYRTDLN